MSCVTEVTGIIGTTLFNKDIRINLTEAFGPAVDESESKSRRKSSVLASAHIQDFMNAIKNQQSKHKDMEHSHMSCEFWGGFATYVGQHAKTKL